MARNDKPKKGVSLAKGPVALLGLALLAYGVSAFILGGHSFTTHPVDGTVNGKSWLGLEVNAWSSLLFIAAGLLLVLGAPAHWGAKTMSLIVGLVLGAASVIALYDKNDVFGIFAANGLTKLVWGAASVALLVLSLLPRVGGGRKKGSKGRDDDDGAERYTSTSRRERTEPVVERETVGRTRPVRDTEPTGDREVVAPAGSGAPREGGTTRLGRLDDEGRGAGGARGTGDR